MGAGVNKWKTSMLLFDEIDRMPWELHEAIHLACRLNVSVEDCVISLLNDFGPLPKTNSEIVLDLAKFGKWKVRNIPLPPINDNLLLGLPKLQSADKEGK